jgi:hypothetical protein
MNVPDASAQAIFLDALEPFRKKSLQSSGAEYALTGEHLCGGDGP